MLWLNELMWSLLNLTMDRLFKWVLTSLITLQAEITLKLKIWTEEN